MKKTIAARVARILRRHFLVRFAHFLPAQHLEGDYGLGPLERLELALYVEWEFQLDLFESELAALLTFGHLVDCVWQHLRARPTPLLIRIPVPVAAGRPRLRRARQARH